MSHLVPDFYEYNLPRDRFIPDLLEKWDSSSYTTLTVQPGTDEAYFIDYFVLRVSDNFAMTATDEMTITFNCYGEQAPTPYATFTIDDASPFIDLAKYSDSRLYEAKAFSGTSYHIFTYPFKPAVYLRSSPTTAESIVFEYDDTGGGITAGTMFINVHGWKLADEDDSGTTVG